MAIAGKNTWALADITGRGVFGLTSFRNNNVLLGIGEDINGGINEDIGEDINDAKSNPITIGHANTSAHVSAYYVSHMSAFRVGWWRDQLLLGSHVVSTHIHAIEAHENMSTCAGITFAMLRV